MHAKSYATNKMFSMLVPKRTLVSSFVLLCHKAHILSTTQSLQNDSSTWKIVNSLYIYIFMVQSFSLLHSKHIENPMLCIQSSVALELV